MPLVIIQTPPLSRDQKNRVGNRIVEALHAEGLSPASIVVLFRPEDADIYVDGGLVHECPELPARPEPPPEPEERGRARRQKPDMGALRTRLVQALQSRGLMSSFEAQHELGLKDDENGAGTLRRLFAELEGEGLIAKQGQKRGTRYVWKGITHLGPPPGSGPILVKREEED